MTEQEVKTPTSHELAWQLLALPERPVSTHANNHTFNADPMWRGWGVLKVRDDGERIIIGNMTSIQSQQ